MNRGEAEAVHLAAQELLAAGTLTTAALNKFVAAFVGWPYAAAPGFVVDSHGTRSDSFACVILTTPVFKDGRVIAWSAMFGHMTDVGGKVPGLLPTDARTIYEEGVSVAPIKIIKGGQLQADLLKVILHNCRLPTWNFSDFNAIVAALRTAAIRCVEISTRFGDDVFYSGMDAMLELIP